MPNDKLTKQKISSIIGNQEIIRSGLLGCDFAFCPVALMKRHERSAKERTR